MDIKNIKKTALFIAIACVLQISESFIPHPIPGVRFGLANIMTLVALLTMGCKAALEVAVLRTVLSSFVLGTFMSPSFMLSFSGALGSAVVMGAVYTVSQKTNLVFLSVVGLSMLGAITHNLVQVSMVYLLLIHHKGVFLLLPWLGISAVIVGWINGLIASQVCQKLEHQPAKEYLQEDTDTPVPSFVQMQYVSKDSIIHRAVPVAKIISVFLIAVSVLFLKSFLFYAVLLFLMLVILYLSRISLAAVFSGIRKLSVIIFFSFAMPVFFIGNGKIISSLGPITITQEGLYLGALFAFRIVLLIVSASLLILTTSPDDLMRGLKKILYPLKFIGISGQRSAAVLMLSWKMLPVLWNRVTSAVRKHLKGKKKLREIIPALSSVIAAVYQQPDGE